MSRNIGMEANLSLSLLLSMTLFSIPPFMFVLPAYFFWHVIVIGIVVLLLLGVIVMASELFRERPNPIGNIALSFLPLFWVAVPFTIIGFLLGIGENKVALAIFIIIWLSDTLAYCSGRLFGKHKLFERVSPNKTIEGFVISLCLTVAIVTSFHWIPFMQVQAFSSPWHWTGFALTVVLFATLGDLVESLFKRSCSVKDSGKVLPGHGGVLDRFDSALLAIPVASIYWIICAGIR
jgi:phosphatidate cytidylyltransferase